MSTPQNDNPDTPRQAENDLLAQQEGQGYGEDEGERDAAFEQPALDEADEQ